jgi:hypothetical protein
MFNVSSRLIKPDNSVQLSYDEKFMMNMKLSMDNFIYSTKNIYKSFYDTNKIDYKIVKQKITSFVDYQKYIKKLNPIFFIYQNDRIYDHIILPSDKINYLYFYLIENISKSSKFNSLYFLNTNHKTKLNGITISDSITIDILNLFSNFETNTYFKYISCIPENIIHQTDIIYNISYGLSSDNISTIFCINTTQLLDIINIILKDINYFIKVIGLENKNRIKKLKLLNDVIEESEIKLLEYIWKDLKVIICNNDNIFCMKRLRKLTNVKIYNPIFKLYNIIIGYDIFYSNTYILDYSVCFYEFIEVNNNVMSNKIIDIDDLEENKFYIIILSNNFYKRLKTNQVILYLNKFHNSIEVKKVCHFHDIIFNNNKIIYPYEIEKYISHLDLIDYCYIFRNNTLNLFIEYISLDNIDDDEINNSKSKLEYNFKYNFDIDISINVLKNNTFDNYTKSKNTNKYCVDIPKRITRKRDIDFFIANSII